MTVAPDLVFGSIDAIGDVKYKLGTGRWLRSDLYEVVAFATAARSARACVVGFRHTTDPHPPVDAFGDTEAQYCSWICDQDLAPVVAADGLAEELAEWLGVSMEPAAIPNGPSNWVAVLDRPLREPRARGRSGPA